MGGTFSPESLARLQALETPASKENMLSPVSQATLAPNSGNNVIRTSPESFTGSSYFDLDNPADPVLQQLRQSPEWQNASEPERRRLEKLTIEQANKDLFERTGEPLVSVGDFEVRTNKVTDPVSGDPRTEFVPRTDIGPVGRTIAGAALGTTQSMLAGVEWLADTPLKALAPIAEHLLGTSDNPVSRAANDSFILENFPTLPADNPTEKLAQEVLSVVIGSVVGAQGALSLDDVTGLSKTSASAITNFFNQAKRVDPQNAAQKTQLFIRAVLAEQGANVGAAITTPESVEPMVQEGFFGTNVGRGFLPEELKVGEQVIINESDMDVIGNYLDNNAFTIGIGVLGGLAGVAKAGATRVAPGLDKLLVGNLDISNQKLRIETALQTLKAIDPNMGENGVALPMLAQAAQKLGDVLERNKEFNTAVYGDGTFASGGSIDLNSTTALQIGAKEYIESVYGFRSAYMSPEEYKALVDADTSKFIENLITLKQSRIASPIINQADSAMTGQMNRIFEDEASAIGTIEQAEQGAQIAAQPVVNDLQTARQMLSGAVANQADAAFKATLAQNESRVIGLLEDAKRSGVLGSDVATKEAMRRLTGKQLLDAVVQRKEEVNRLFEAIPDDVLIDNQALVDRIASLATTPDPLGRIGVPTARPQLNAMSDTALNDLINDLDAKPMSFKELFTVQRPLLSKRITELFNQGENTDQLEAVRSYIDELAADQVANGDESTKAAMAAHIKFQQDFAPSKELGYFLDASSDYKPGSIPDSQGLRKGELDTLIAGAKLWETARDFKVPEQAQAFLNMIQQGTTNNITTEVAELYTGLALDALRQTEGGGVITAQQLSSAMEPYRAILEQVNSPTLKIWDDSVEAIKMSESGLNSANDGLRQAQIGSQEAIQRAQDIAISKFITNIGGNAELLDNPRAAFYEIFSDNKAGPNMVRELMANAEVQNNPLLKAGIESQFLRYLREKAFTNTGIGVAGDGTRVVEPGATALNKMLLGGGDNTLQVMRAVFKDDPKRADAIEGILNVMNLAINAKAVRPGPRGSTTMLDSGMQQSVNRMLTIAFGVLNPTATKIKAISGAITGNYNSQLQDTILRILDTGISNPQFLAESMELLRKDASGETLAAYLQKTLGVANNLMFKGTLNSTKSTDDETTPQSMWNETAKWFEGNNQSMISEPVNQQMNDLFN